MGDNSKIQWTDASWNPVTGCTRVSPGCDHCYMMAQWPRLHGMGVKGYEGESDQVHLHPDRLDIPLHWQRPRKIFVCSMSDLFHPRVPIEFIAKVYAAMLRAKQHTFQVLTKRPGRAASIYPQLAELVRLELEQGAWSSIPPGDRLGDWWKQANSLWPLPNVWVGTSVESAKYLPRLDVLARVPAPVRFVSCEPLLGPLDLRPWLMPDKRPIHSFAENQARQMEDLMPGVGQPLRRAGKVHWVIVGGESGAGARPMYPGWPSDIRDQCLEAGVPFFFKQHGEWRPLVSEPLPIGKRYVRVDPDGNLGTQHPNYRLVARVGRNAAGALLDGHEHKEMPNV